MADGKLLAQRRVPAYLGEPGRSPTELSRSASCQQPTSLHSYSPCGAAENHANCYAYRALLPIGLADPRIHALVVR